jgi:hypothetical protein
MAEPAAKRAREDVPSIQPETDEQRRERCGPYVWHLRFLQSAVLRQWVENVHGITQTSEPLVEILRSDDIEGLRVRAMTAANISFLETQIVGQVRCDKEDAGTQVVDTICLRLGHVLSCLRGARSMEFVEIWKPADKPDAVRLCSCEPGNAGSRPLYDLSLLADNEGPLDKLSDEILHEFEIDAQELRTAARCGKEHKACSLVFKAVRVRGARGDADTFMELEYSGDEVRGRHVVPCERVEERYCQLQDPPSDLSDPRRVDPDRLELLLSRRFSIDVLLGFVKCCERGTVRLRFLKNGTMALEHVYGPSTQEFYRYIVAPLVED